MGGRAEGSLGTSLALGDLEPGRTEKGECEGVGARCAHCCHCLRLFIFTSEPAACHAIYTSAHIPAPRSRLPGHGLWGGPQGR